MGRLFQKISSEFEMKKYAKGGVWLRDGDKLFRVAEIPEVDLSYAVDADDRQCNVSVTGEISGDIYIPPELLKELIGECK